ncbi:MAG: hypothetical protein FWH36_06020, partial [Lentimicrobiaceae bacterium]|nr:hypothetical protein [Lentimicrobiaceae bacterium]
MNRLVSIFRKVIVCCMLLGAAWAAQAQAFSGSGSGTTADPYIINDAAQLDEVRNDLAAHYRLGSDIDLTAYLASGGAGYAKWGASGWLPIGANFTTRFAGSFNGAGYKISGLTIARSGTDYVGLFGYTGGASIDSLGIENCNIAGNNRVGGLAGHNGAAASGGSTFSNCYVTGIVTGGGSNVGGLIGDNDNNSVVSNCYAAATVNGGGSSSSVGGLVGVNNASTISNCYATGTVTGGNNYIGGLVGQNPNLSTISNCYATGTVNGGNNYVGGLAGGNGGGSGSSTISNCYATGTVRGGNNYIGGLVGSNYNSSPTIKNCVAANDSVIATGSPTYINRIVGNTGTLINNYANEDMVVMENGSPYDISANIGLSDLAGANANMASLKTLAFYNTAGNWNTQEWDIDNVDNSAKIWQICEGENLPFLQWQEDIACTPPPTVVGNNSIVFVNKTVVGGDGSGSSWANAAPELADALQAAKFYAGTPNSISEIWVAASTYLPLYTAVEGATGDDGRNNAFVLIKDLAVYGGFPQNANDTDNAPSLTSPLSTLTLEQARNTRDWNANPTVLSGERGNPNSLTDNCFHVVVAVNITRNSVLDGFTVTKGYANAAIGSFYVVDGQQIDRRNGGGIYTKNASSLTLCNLVVDSNRAVNWGGGIYNDTNSAPLIKNSILMRNQALYGGGIYNMMGAVVMTDLVIKSNYVSFGGSGIDNNQASAVVNNTLILNNTANNIGGGVHNQGAAPKFTNVLIAKNHAGQGGGMYSSTTSRPVLTNVTMSGNYAAVAGTATYAGGGGFYNTGSSRPAVNNCIVWGNYEGTNTPSEVLNAAGTSYLNPSYSLIGGGTLSGGIILNGDPLFVDTAAGDYQLQVGSPAKNEGDTNLYKTARGIADFTNEPDLAGNPRLFDGNIDLGAYENPTLTPLVFTPDANG